MEIQNSKQQKQTSYMYVFNDETTYIFNKIDISIYFSLSGNTAIVEKLPIIYVFTIYTKYTIYTI